MGAVQNKILMYAVFIVTLLFWDMSFDYISMHFISFTYLEVMATQR